MLKNLIILSIIIFLLMLLNVSIYSSEKKMEEKSFHQLQKAIFAGGCFWCTESDFEKIPGVISVISGYDGGSEENPTYHDYAQKGYVEVIEITYDKKQVTYDQLLTSFWQHINPTDAGGQFVDRGPQYRSVIFYLNEQQKIQAKKSRQKLINSGIFDADIATDILPTTHFYPAEDYHQDYYKKNSLRYKYYRYRSGRDDFINKIWTEENKKKLTMDNQTSLYKKPTKEELKKILSDESYYVTQENGTEKPFQNKYWSNKKAGIYVDIVSGEPLFSSKEKYRSGTGWPSFYKPLVAENIVEKTDKSLFNTRTEIRSKHADSHLGHVFKDGPAPTGLRYCMNSAALRFVPKQDMEKEGYGKYLKHFNE